MSKQQWGYGNGFAFILVLFILLVIITRGFEGVGRGRGGNHQGGHQQNDDVPQNHDQP